MELIKFNPEQIELIKRTIVPKATDDELGLFLHQCRRTGLDPMTRQIYGIHRWNSAQKREVMQIQLSIDGFRVIAERSGDYGGQDEPLFTYGNDGRLYMAKVTVYRFRGETRYSAAVGVAIWDEYCQTTKDGKPAGLWATMPHVMLSKVAEAVALRKAYPNDLSGLYTAEEMDQIKNEAVKTANTPTTIDVIPKKPNITDAQLTKAIERIANGDESVLQKTLDFFEITPEQKQILESAKPFKTIREMAETIVPEIFEDKPPF